MIYSKFTFYPTIIKRHLISKLKYYTELSDNDILLYDCHDLVIRKTDFSNFIFDTHWKIVKENPKIKILIFFPDEYFNLIDIKRFVTVIREKEINENQIYFLVMDENFKNFAIREFIKYNLNINIDSYNGLLKSIKEPSTSTMPTKKFSALSRNYSTWRLNLYIKLLQNNLLRNFVYTFNNIHPYGDKPRIIPKEEILENLTVLGVKHTLEVKDWVNHLPISVGSVEDKHSDFTYKLIQKSDINLLIESHFDPFWTFYGERNLYTPEEFSPAFPTEKTYKAIICKKPFIAVSTPYFLKELKQLGYKTFSPFIDESYDNIVNDDQRLEAIIKEVNRISLLPYNEYKSLIESLKEVAEYNYQQVLIQKQKPINNENFFWLNEYLKV